MTILNPLSGNRCIWLGLSAALLQTWEGTACQKDMVPDNTLLHPVAFASKSLKDTEHRYSNIEREALGILHGLKKFHHYCFGREVYVATNHKPLESIFKNDMATLSQQIQHILIKFHQQRVQILYKPGPTILLQTGCPIIITRKTKTNQNKGWT